MGSGGGGGESAAKTPSSSQNSHRSNKVRIYIKTDVYKLSSIKNIDLDKVKSQEFFLRVSSEVSSQQASSDRGITKTKTRVGGGGGGAVTPKSAAFKKMSSFTNFMVSPSGNQ